MMLSVLVVDADPNRRDHVRTILEFMDYEVHAVSSPDDLGGEPAETVAAFLGHDRSHEQSLAWARQIRIRFPGTPLLLLSEPGSRPLAPELAVEFNAVTEWPLRLGELRVLLGQFHSKTGPAIVAPRRSLELFRCLVGDSPVIVRIRQLIEQVANSGTSALILGEPGTGKEVAARKLHYFSDRRDKPFVSLDCSAQAPEQLNADLFGEEKQADGPRAGCLEVAEGGTLFLEEIGELNPALQARLWRTLQTRVFERVGGTRPLTANVRVIAASSDDLMERVRQGRFREDLYQHLQVVPIGLPPLRDRAQDIPFLIEELNRRSRNERRAGVRLTRAATDALVRYSWPRNLHELAGLIERLAILHPNGTVDLHDLPAPYTTGIEMPATAVAEAPASDVAADPASLPRLPREGLDIKEHLNNLEYTLIKQALDEAGGVVAHAAERLRLRRTTLVEKLRKYGINRNSDEASGF